MAQLRDYVSGLFTQDTVTVAKGLIGTRLVFDSPNGKISGIINETEAYTQEDPSCHAYLGKRTKRNSVMFLPPGHIYIYFVYGMYYCMNFVTESSGRGCAVLIRSVIPDPSSISIMKKNRDKDTEKGLADGPAKLVLAYGISLDLNGTSIFSESSLISIEQQSDVLFRCDSYQRIGISKGKEFLWRFKGCELAYNPTENRPG